MLVGLESIDPHVVVGIHSNSSAVETTVDNQTLRVAKFSDDFISSYYPAGCVSIGIWLQVDSVLSVDCIQRLESLLTGGQWVHNYNYTNKYK